MVLSIYLNDLPAPASNIAFDKWQTVFNAVYLFSFEEGARFIIRWQQILFYVVTTNIQTDVMYMISLALYSVYIVLIDFQLKAVNNEASMFLIYAICVMVTTNVWLM